jgi:hypothetical protein
MAEGGIKAQGGLAEALVSGAKHVVIDEAMAQGKAAGLLPCQAEMAHGKGLLLRRQPPGCKGRGVSWWAGGSDLWHRHRGRQGTEGGRFPATLFASFP